MKQESESRLRPIVLFMTICCGLAGQATAQVTTAELRGLVKDPSANVVPGAEVRVQNLDTGLSRSVQTSKDGSHTFLGLGPGRYSLYLEATDFRPALTKKIVLNVGQKAELSFRLEVSPIMEAIEVLSKTQLLEARRTSVSTTIVEQLIKGLPGQNRDALSLARASLYRFGQPSDVRRGPCRLAPWNRQRGRRSSINSIRNGSSQGLTSSNFAHVLGKGEVCCFNCSLSATSWLC